MHSVLNKVREERKMKKLKSMMVFLLFVFIFLFLQLWLIRKPPEEPVISSVVLPHVIVHIDLKGAPPKLTYLESLLPILKAHGVTGLLMEYEDMFPYEGKLVNISSRNCYDKTELGNFLRIASSFGMEIIPLVQTFGGMEHVLKLQEFMHLRETPAYPDMICPTNNESRTLVKNMLQQVLDFHTPVAAVRHIHLGFHEVLQINDCRNCSARDLSDIHIMTDYLRHIANYVKTKNPNTIVLMWDDLLRSTEPLQWGNLDLPKNVEIVTWDFAPNIRTSNIQLTEYHQECEGIWISSAFKGESEVNLPRLQHWFLNNFNWMTFIMDFRFGGERHVYNFRGIIISGWSRSSHMDPPCELLAPSLPSLILSLLVIKQFQYGVNRDITENQLLEHIDHGFYKFMRCNISQKDKMLRLSNINQCEFDGRNLYAALQRYEILKKQLNDLFGNFLFSIEYYANMRFINPNLMITHFKWCNRTLTELIEVENKLKHFMKPFYNNDVIEEYVNYKIYSPKKKLKYFLKILISFKKMQVWERNPYHNKTALNDASVKSVPSQHTPSSKHSTLTHLSDWYYFLT